MTAIEVAINGGNKAAEKEFLVLTELLMSQLLKLDSIAAEGEAKLQRKAEVVLMILGCKAEILIFCFLFSFFPLFHAISHIGHSCLTIPLNFYCIKIIKKCMKLW